MFSNNYNLFRTFIMKNSLWKSFKNAFSSYSYKTSSLYRIFILKGDIYLLNRKKNKYFKKIGEMLYIELLNHKEFEQILEKVQPMLSKLDNIDKKIETYKKEILSISEKENISESEVAKIDEFINNANKKANKFFDDDDFDDEEDTTV